MTQKQSPTRPVPFFQRILRNDDDPDDLESQIHGHWYPNMTSDD